MEGTFSERVLNLALAIPEGKVTTYGALARAAGGGSMASRSVSSILAKFPNQRTIPWHRIVYAGGKVWLTNSNEAKRRKLYKRENIHVNSKGIITNFEDVFFDFS